jgi:hypothetical protein
MKKKISDQILKILSNRLYIYREREEKKVPKFGVEHLSTLFVCL